MRGVHLRMHRLQVVHRLFHERVDLRLLRIGGVDLHVKVLQHMVDVCGHVGCAVRPAHHHHSMAAVHTCGRGPGAGTGRERGARDECHQGVAIEQETAQRLLAAAG